MKKLIKVKATTTREQWLNAATVSLRDHFAASGNFKIPENVKVTCGFPSRGALAQRKRTVGQCWDKAASTAGLYEVFISPVLSESLDAIATLAHELVHVTVGLDKGHKGPFKKCALAIGLEGKMTSTVAGEKFLKFATPAIVKLGPYPHAQFNPRHGIKKQGTRLVKCECEECGYTVRTTRAWLDLAGAPICPLDEIAMEEC